MKRTILALSFLTTQVLFLVGCDNENSDENVDNTIKTKPVTVQILHTNDHHSHLEGQPYDFAIDFDQNVEGSEFVQVDLGGFARIATLINEYRDENSLVLNSGELNGTLYFSLFKGEADVKVFNELNLDAYQLGNHEFDEGDKGLADLIDIAEFPMLSANLKATENSPLFGKPILPYVIKEIDGEKIAILGLIKVEKTKESSLVSDDVQFTDEITTAKQYVQELTRLGINKIILLSHLGFDFDQIVAKEVSGIDLIISGDTHELLYTGEELDKIGLKPKGAYPTLIQNPEGDNVHIIEAWEYAKAMGRYTVEFDEFGKIKKAMGNPILPLGETFFVKDSANKIIPADDGQTQHIRQVLESLEVIKFVEPSANITALLEPYQDEIEKFKTEQIGYITETLSFERIPTPFEPGFEANGSFSAQVVADSFLQYFPQADIAIQNSGGVRAEFKEGIFTTADAIEILPFSNKITLISIKGEDVVKVLNEAVVYSQGVSGSTGAFPYSSNLRYDVQLGGDLTNSVLNVEVLNKETGIWEKIELDKTYNLVTNSFTAQGKDGYVTFGRLLEQNPADFKDSDAAYSIPLIEYFTEYLKASDGILNKPDDFCLKSVRVIN